jgi:type II secretory pathway component PulK
MALVMVMAAIALIAFVAARFSQRIDELRHQTSALGDYAQAALQSRNALAAGLYYMTTRPIGTAGFGPLPVPDLRADERPYQLPGGAELRVQDVRGLLPLNAAERQSLGSVLQSLGVPARDTDAYFDVLEDYTDADSLKRLNGAEAPDYAAAGLPPPRNDWLRSVRELGAMPRWRDAPQVLAAFQRWASPARRAILNPNTAPMDLLAARWPRARPEQLQLLAALRAATPFTSGAQAQAATGLPLDRDDVLFHVGTQLRVTVSAPGSSMALQYNVTLVPGGRDAPWLISDVQAVPRAETRDAPDRAEPFPLALQAARKP